MHGVGIAKEKETGNEAHGKAYITLGICALLAGVDRDEAGSGAGQPEHQAWKCGASRLSASYDI